MKIGEIVMFAIVALVLLGILLSVGGFEWWTNRRLKVKDRAKLPALKSKIEADLRERVSNFVNHEAANYPGIEERWDKLVVYLYQCQNRDKVQRVEKYPEEKRVVVTTGFTQIEIEVNW